MKASLNVRQVKVGTEVQRHGDGGWGAYGVVRNWSRWLELEAGAGGGKE